MFTTQQFDVFTQDGLDARMAGIRSEIQPLFHRIYDEVGPQLEADVGIPLYLHVAKHARRTVNPPKDTWMAICHDKRGYKKHPHFQVGLFDDRVFVWLAFIYEMPNKEAIGRRLMALDFKSDFPDFHIAGDHMKKDAFLIEDMSTESIETMTERFATVKKADFLIGRQLPADASILQNEAAFLALVEDTFSRLMPIYRDLVL
ncbi:MULTISPECIES: DUF1054 domain-containing protein [unclassified Exiguobacterium]|uniref:DUF1054 domain-containing protein n=1 Tax=unclassified Exiguobacterium TaxID=2644629 RepID=UPI00103F757D|nr:MULTISPECIES: DUF1054 domain-containing protein [unclassified Exiguobacterium]TCI72669.1 DUF1054 domain-containing protein [Exiguobacterium sp. IPCI3]TCI82069.1 DUF1054 domain-containing protein [Exiguobacterium sp. IPCH1]TCI83574.1 DUF1054 domain-containing protein [Exiguobacterium sp. IPBC4]